MPWLHIAEVVAEEAARRGFATPRRPRHEVSDGGARSTWRRCESSGSSARFPTRQTASGSTTIIFKELVNGIFSEESRLYFNEVMEGLRERGCDAAVLGCTEIPLLVRPDDAPAADARLDAPPRPRRRAPLHWREADQCNSSACRLPVATAGIDDVEPVITTRAADCPCPYRIPPRVTRITPRLRESDVASTRPRFEKSASSRPRRRTCR